MGKKTDNIWMENYLQLKAYIQMHHQMPDKKKIENRGLLNWWKYNKKRLKAGKLELEKVERLLELSNMRTIHR